jgi:hypothetical protein
VYRMRLIYLQTGPKNLNDICGARSGVNYASSTFGQIWFILNPVTGISQGVETLMSRS